MCKGSLESSRCLLFWWHSLNACSSLLILEEQGTFSSSCFSAAPPGAGRASRTLLWASRTLLWANRELGVGRGKGLDIPDISENHTLSSQPAISAAGMSIKFWKYQSSTSPWVEQSGHKNHSDGFCGSRERPVPVSASPFPVQLLVLPGLLLCSRKIQRGRRRDWFTGAGAAQTKPEQNKLIRMRLVQGDVRVFHFCGENKNPKPLAEAWAVDALLVLAAALPSAAHQCFPHPKLSLPASPGGPVPWAGVGMGGLKPVLVKISRSPCTTHRRALLTGVMKSSRKVCLVLQELQQVSRWVWWPDTFMP